MPTKKIGDIPPPCSDPGHNPPSHMVYERGVYEHTCPSCGRKIIFTVNPPTLKGPRDSLRSVPYLHEESLSSLWERLALSSVPRQGKSKSTVHR